MRIILAYKNFAANRAVSHIGLGVTALNAARTIRAAGTPGGSLAHRQRRRTAHEAARFRGIANCSHLSSSRPHGSPPPISRNSAPNSPKPSSQSTATRISASSRPTPAPCASSAKVSNSSAPHGTSASPPTASASPLGRSRLQQPCLCLPNIYHLDRNIESASVTNAAPCASELSEPPARSRIS